MKIKSSITLLIILFWGCQTRNKLEIEFENQLPETDKIILERIVKEYDDFIEMEYAGNASDFFLEIETRKQKFEKLKKQQYCDLIKLINQSTLEYKNERVKYDSVYVSENGSIITIMQDQDLEDGEDKYGEEISILPIGKTIEDELKEIKERGYWRFISDSSFRIALTKISKTRQDIQGYLEAKDMQGQIYPTDMAAGIRRHDMDVDEYFIKRIIAIELFIQQIKINYGC